ncbi:MAG: F0F1 ATP synthase subunit epsilon [Inquilinaceae bacterium]
MAGKVAFDLVSPERLLLSVEVDMVVVPGTDGNFGVLPGHAPLISTVRPGVIDVYEDRAAISRRIFVAGGFAEVTPERCTVLAEQATPTNEIDAAAVGQQIKDLGEDLGVAESAGERQRIEKALAVARAKLDASRAA